MSESIGKVGMVIRVHNLCSRSALWSAFASLLCLLLMGSVPASARTLYVSPHGSDHASGRSPRRAWRTVTQVDRAHLKPGDRVLFRGGARFGDDTLMPGWGSDVSGTSTAPIVFGSYGGGRARLADGVWIKNERHLVFEDLALGPDQGVSGTGDHIVVKRCVMRGFFGAVQTPLQPRGSDWAILDNSIDRTGDSGMLLQGSRYLVVGNVITQTGLDQRISYGTHGVYLKAPDSVVENNTIIGFRNNGISVRYRNSVVRDNVISGGEFGIAWFQYGPGPGTSIWTGNRITHTRIAGIYVSRGDIGGQTDENFVIDDNRIGRPAGHPRGWKPIALSADRGWYAVHRNAVVS